MRPLALPAVLTAALLIPPGVPAVAEASAPDGTVNAATGGGAEVDASTPDGYDSPYATFDAARDAFNDRRWADFLSAVSPDQRSPLVGQLVTAFSTLAQRPGADAAVGTLLRRHFPAGVPAALQTLDAAPADRAAAVDAMDDPSAFFAEATGLAMTLEHGELAHLVLVEEMDDLRPYKTPDGASHRAVKAVVTLRRPDAKELRRDVWNFIVIGKRWYLAPLGAGA